MKLCIQLAWLVLHIYWLSIYAASSLEHKLVAAHFEQKTTEKDLPKLTDKIAARRMTLAGHCIRHPKLPVSR